MLTGRIEDAVALARHNDVQSLAQLFSTGDAFMEDRYDAARDAVLEFLRLWLPFVPPGAMSRVAEEVFGACALGLAPASGAQQVAAAYLRRAMHAGSGDLERLATMLDDVTRHPDYDPNDPAGVA